jgi:cyanophycinase
MSAERGKIKYQRTEAMGGHIVLEGGAEFGGRMAEPDLHALHLAGGFDVPVSIIPAAAALDNNHEHAGQTGVRWFSRLGATKVTLLPLIDQASANQKDMAAALADSRLIYLLGGFPHYLARTLTGSISWRAVLEAYRGGAVIAGSSAGAMVLCQHFYDPETGTVIQGLNLIPKACVIPHHDTLGKRWLSHLRGSLSEHVVIGIDEMTGMIDDGADGTWNVYGKGAVTLYRAGEATTHQPGETFSP